MQGIDVKRQGCTHLKKKKELFLEEQSLELKLKRSAGAEGNLRSTHQTRHLQSLEQPPGQLAPGPREGAPTAQARETGAAGTQYR